VTTAGSKVPIWQHKRCCAAVERNSCRARQARVRACSLHACF